MLNVLLWIFAIIGLLCAIGIIGILIEGAVNKDNIDNLKICIFNSKLSDKYGIVFKEEYDGNKYTCYNFPEENYYGIIKVNVKSVNEKELDKILTKLKLWSEQEKNKNARIKAYQNSETF